MLTPFSMIRTHSHWRRSVAGIFFSGMVLSGLSTLRAAHPQLPNQQPPSLRGREIIEIGVNGEFISTLGLPSVSLQPGSGQFTLYMETEIPRRRKFRLEGVDSEWREATCEMTISARFFNEKGEQSHEDVETVSGESPGWNGSLENPIFTPRKRTLTVPPGARSFRLVIVSAGPPSTLGTLLVKGVKITRQRGNGPPEVVMRAPVGREPRAPWKPAPSGFTADGLRPNMAKLLTLASKASDGQPEECFAIIDDDVNAHAEWRTLKEAAVEVAEGDRLDVEWQEAYSIGEGTFWAQDYDFPPPGTYHLRVRPVDLQGFPNGEETTLSICILPPWWQRAWVWALGAVGMLTLALGVSRYVVHQRTRDELARMKEVALRKAEVELTRMARATALGEFTASIAHEISQPLSGITTNASACLRWLAPERGNLEEARAAVQRIIGDSDRAVRIVTRIRALLAKETLIRESSSINTVIEELLALLKSDIRRRGVVLECVLKDDLPTVAIDRVQIQQVIMNLVINGLDAMNGISDRPRLLRIHTVRDAETILVKVEDSGVGLDPATIGRLFERFFTTKSEGLGMGLAICQSIVESHGGRLVALRNTGHGATFQFTLPIETRVIP